MNKLFYVHLFHIILIGGLFLYVGIRKSNIPNWMYTFLVILGIFLILYHGFKAYKHIIAGQFPWINLFHIIIVAPLLIIIGLNGKKTPFYYFEFLLMLGFTSIGYHGYYLLLEQQFI